jgi:NAD(P)-dependent dehydrogenase (short-subunit alcohol dehydrogenase family)
MTDHERLVHLFGLEGQVAVVTGGTRGIGMTMARALLDAGASVVVASRDAAACEAAQASLSPFGSVLAHASDLSTVAGCEELATIVGDRFGGVDILVNNAGTTWGAPFDEFPEGGWDKIMDLNLKAPFFASQKFAPLLKARGTSAAPSRIVNIGSIDGLQVSGGINYSYGAAKAGVHHLTRILAKELAPSHILVNAIAPGPFATKMMAPLLRDHGDRITESSPLGRIGEDDDIAGAVIYLTSRASAWVTGAVLTVDGGISTTLATDWLGGGDAH